MHGDIIDNAQAQEALNLQVALANRSKTEFVFTGFCHNCDHPIVKGTFCDADCREDWQKLQHANKHRRVEG